jgi:hypothetical protein
VGRITFSDHPLTTQELEMLPDYGEMGLAMLGDPAEITQASTSPNDPSLKENHDVSVPLSDRLVGGLGRMLQLRPGQSQQVTFVLTWRFPNLEIGGLGKVGRRYAVLFDSARAVAQYMPPITLRACPCRPGFGATPGTTPPCPAGSWIAPS